MSAPQPLPFAKRPPGSLAERFWSIVKSTAPSDDETSPEPRAVVQFFPQVPGQLRNVLMKAMGPFPEERYRSLKEMREHLDRFVEGRPDETPGKVTRRPLRGLTPSPADLAFTPVEELAPTRVV